MARCDVARARRARFAGQGLHSFIAAEIAALAVASPQPATHGVVKGQIMLLQLTIDSLKEFLRFNGSIHRRPSFAAQFDKLFSQPSKDSLTHSISALNAAIVYQRVVRINAL